MDFIEGRDFQVETDETDDLTAADIWHPVQLPEGLKCKSALVQVRNTAVVSFDPSVDCNGFLWSYQATGPGFLYQAEGKAVVTAKIAGKVLGYIKAAAGKIIIVEALN